MPFNTGAAATRRRALGGGHVSLNLSRARLAANEKEYSADALLGKRFNTNAAGQQGVCAGDGRLSLGD
jgi:hypothetical protein